MIIIIFSKIGDRKHLQQQIVLFKWNFCLHYLNKECTSEEELAKSLGKRPLSSSSIMRCKDILVQMAPYYKYHGINIKSSYSDFDQHNIGLVTESQVCIKQILHLHFI